MNETRLRDLLEQAAPTHPDVDPTSRAASVVRRGRTARVRDRALVAVAAVSVVAVAVAIPHVVGGGDGPDQAVAPVTAAPCPASPIDTMDQGPVGALDDIVAVRACPARGGGDELSPEPLTGADAQAFADDVTALPDYQLPAFCMVATVKADPWALQLQTADGELLTLGSPMRTCSPVVVDGTNRGVDGVVAAFLGNLAGVPETLACPQDDADALPIWNASFDPATATAGILCATDDDGGAWLLQTTLTADQVAGVRDDMATNLRDAPGDACDQPVRTPRLLVLADDAGDQAAYLDLGCGEGFTSARGTWTPAPSTLSGLTR